MVNEDKENDIDAAGRKLQFRQWATKVLDTFTKQGYVLDKERLINGQIFKDI